MAADATPPADEPPSRIRTESPVATAPDWVAPMVRRTVWRAVFSVLAVVVLVLVTLRARSVVSMVLIALFFGLAMDPAVTFFNRKWGWRRGAGTGAVFVALLVFVVLLVWVLIPAIVQMTGQISQKLPEWINQIEQTFHISVSETTAQASAQTFNEQLDAWVQDNGLQLLGLAGSAVSFIFQFFTIAMFAFYFAADAPQIRRAILTKFSPERQQRIGWAMDTAVAQTGGYFYSRLLLMFINGGLFFIAMLAVGVDVVIALPMAVFEGFVAEFIPAVGTYIGAAVPIIVTLGLVGVVPALILLGWTIIYQQVENYFLSPKISARTMEINGGVAFGAALAGGAIAGPMGAFMSLPIAAMITSFLRNFSRSYPLAYRSHYDPILAEEAEQEAAEAAQRPEPGEPGEPAEPAATAPGEERSDG